MITIAGGQTGGIPRYLPMRRYTATSRVRSQALFAPVDLEISLLVQVDDLIKCAIFL